jgi:hypothetical protein
VKRWCLLIALTLSAPWGGCAATRGTFAPARDYADYRVFVLADGMGEKLGAAWTYLRRHPDGEYKEEVAKFFFPTEAKFYAEAGRTPGGAAAYLQFLPDGPHAEEERTFLRAFEIEQREGPLRAKRALEDARKKAEASRRALGDAVESWTRRALAIESWQSEKSALEPSKFGVAYFKEQPLPICDAEGCSKFFTYTYPVPEVDTALDRNAVLEVRVELTAGLLTAVSLVLPKRGFMQWLEGSEGRPLDMSDGNTRAESIVRARNRIESIVREVRGGGCTTDEEETTRRVTCGDIRVAIGTTPSGDDVVRVINLK